ncbi:hypothetical protein ZWY2020_004438 [Hordeum vulgare]|nr:hypothetical protein ZWY2020_004438 [Hordeum vulgare]
MRLVELMLDLAGTDDVGQIPLDEEAAYLLAASRLRDPLERHLRAHAPPAMCIVSDICHPWTAGLAAGLGVPRLSFLGMSAYCLMCLQTEHHAAAMHNAYAAMDPYWHLMPEEPVEVKMPTAAPGFLRLPSNEKLAYVVERPCADVDGVVLNTFLELEQGTVVDCVEVRNVAVWAVGPVSLFHRHEHAAALAARGNAPALDADECMQWLDGKAPSSVVYVSFGSSIVHADPKQVVEIGLGLSYVNGLCMTLGSSTPRYDDWDHAPNAIADPFASADLFAMSTETIALNFKERTPVKERTLRRRLGRARCQAGSWIFIANKAGDTQLDLHCQQGQPSSYSEQDLK